MDNFMMNHEDSWNVLKFFHPNLAENCPSLADNWLWHYIGIGETIERIGVHFPELFKNCHNLETVALYTYFSFIRRGITRLSHLMAMHGIIDEPWSGKGDINIAYLELNKFYLYATSPRYATKDNDFKDIVRGMIQWVKEETYNAEKMELWEKRLYRILVVRFCIDFPVEYAGIKMAY